ncbi:50S ribosomal protein L23 [Pelagibacteraceae bacterium]|jgi:large subunit ribosomal protein L23|nr:50S ribosomal protein L23 [Pelagibacteraceae bacterium]MDB3872961.1 50S ribosomal protein L23 [Pelagibacteraceae bacterium]|tara:strand:- start:494 stop:790 length:297 start_codon:yes stop_codon:yes gene_type:complete
MKNDNSAFDIILSPVVTEKSTNLNALNKLTFKVAKDANKNTIKKSIEKLYKVEVIKINTILSKPKTKIVRGKIGTKTGYKKAIVTLKEGQTIDVTAGV